MGPKKRAKSQDDELQSAKGLQEQEGYLHELDLSNHNQSDAISKATKRTNAADKFNWTRIFGPDDPISYMLQHDELQPGIFCINDDLEANKTLVQEKDSDDDRVAVPLFEPRSFVQEHGDLL